MTTRDAFSVEEWANIATLDEAVGGMLSDAEIGGSVRENRELLKVLREAASQFPNDELIASIAAGTYDDRAASLEQPWRASGVQPTLDAAVARCPRRSRERLRAILRAWAPPELGPSTGSTPPPVPGWR